MDFERYDSDQISEYSYRFISTGPRGAFKMHVRFAYIEGGIYNLGFGVVDLGSGQLNDRIETRNGDSEKILATVASIALEFLRRHPTASIYAAGSTSSRTRLYQMGINRILPSLKQYEIAGLIVDRDPDGNTPDDYFDWKGKWTKIEKGVAYDAFLLFDPLMTKLDNLFNN